MNSLPTLDTVREAHERIADGLIQTPCAVSAPLSFVAGMTIIAKHDYQQVTGSFKERGARNALLSLDTAARRRGVIAASAGNHALGLAHHGAQLGIAVTVVMPRNAPRVKAGRCHALGAHVVLHGDTFAEAASHAWSIANERGLSFIHPFDDPVVMAGQGTMALEILEQTPDFDAMVVPVGGGGFLVGVATVLKRLRPEVRIIGVEPAHAASLSAALNAGRPVLTPTLPTLADGLAVAQTGVNTFAAATRLVDRMITVSEEELTLAMLTLYEHENLVVEGAGAAALAACLSGRLSELNGQRVVVPLCGRNIDPTPHARALFRARLFRDDRMALAES